MTKDDWMFFAACALLAAVSVALVVVLDVRHYLPF